jgi:hypothetical protein
MIELDNTVEALQIEDFGRRSGGVAYWTLLVEEAIIKEGGIYGIRRSNRQFQIRWPEALSRLFPLCDEDACEASTPGEDSASSFVVSVHFTVGEMCVSHY